MIRIAFCEHFDERQGMRMDLARYQGKVGERKWQSAGARPSLGGLGFKLVARRCLALKIGCNEARLRKRK